MVTEQTYLKVKEAATLLGVSESTLRNWERAGKITAYRHPMNGYRLFKRADIESVLSQIEQSKRGRETGPHQGQEGE
jgi:MerR family copper efflux transcriptional regulator